MANFNGRLSFWAGAIATIGLLLTGHWFPWTYFLGRELPRVASYVYGSGAVLTGFSIWRFLRGDTKGPVRLWQMYIVSGLAVMAAYIIDFLAVIVAGNRQDDQL